MSATRKNPDPFSLRLVDGGEEPRARPEPVPRRPASTQATANLLASVAVISEGLAELLDGVRTGYPPSQLSGPDPVYVALDQASAAAHDLYANVRAAVDELAGRNPGIDGE